MQPIRFRIMSLGTYTATDDDTADTQSTEHTADRPTCPFGMLASATSLAAEAYEAYHKSRSERIEPTPFEQLGAGERDAWAAAANHVARQITTITSFLAAQRQNDAERIMRLCVAAATEGATLTAVRELASCPDDDGEG